MSMNGWNITLGIEDVSIKPYVRMTKRGKWVKPQAKEYLASKSNLQWKIKEAMQEHGYRMMPEKEPLYVSAIVLVHTSQGHRADLDNILKAILDACNGIVYPDDRWIDSIDIDRKIGDNEYLGLLVGVK